MLMIPIQSKNHDNDMLIVIIDDNNVARMKTADPPEVVLKDCGKILINPRILICHENDSPELTRILQNRDIEKIVQYLERGFEFRPDKGDHDNGPQSIVGTN